MKKVLLITLMVVLLASSAMSFDGMRKGFVLGGGLGFCANADWSIDDTNLEVSGSGIGLNLLIGYAWDEQNMIVYEGNVAGYSESGVNITQGYNGASFYHYFGEVGKSMFLSGGLGFYVLEVEDWPSPSIDPGFGFLAGAGYEFARHWQVGVYFSHGKTSWLSGDFNHNHISLLVSGVAF